MLRVHLACAALLKSHVEASAEDVHRWRDTVASLRATLTGPQR